jgi:nitrite reductase/ring-hydroxylating ferredoxin subunit
LVQVDAINGRVKLRLGGNCDGCASSMATVKLAVESAIHELAPEITGIEVDGLRNEAAPKSFINSNGHSKQPSWMPLGHETPQKSGELATAEVTGERILLCRVGKHLYAYRELCPACGSPIGSTALDGEILSCASCEERYNVRFAGRALGRRELHLDPVPLLENDLGVKVALPGVAL